MASDTPSSDAAKKLNRYVTDPALPAELELYTAADDISLYIELSPQDPFTYDDVVNLLAPLGIVHLDQQSLKTACASAPMSSPVLIASGQPVKHGIPGRIEYKFRVDEKSEVEFKEDDSGRVDFRDVDTVRHVSEGDVLAEVIPPKPGVPGQDVFGNPVEPEVGLPISLDSRAGANVRLNDEGTKALAECDGMVNVENGKIKVSSLYKIAGDVDFETGNVNFKGDVVISGFVREDFTVKASGNVIVERNIERATVSAGNDVIVKGGIIGKEGVSVTAGNKITATYADNADLEAKETIVIVNEMLHSVARARKVLVHDGRGAVLGGEIHAIECVNVSCTADPDSGIRTLVAIDRDPEIVRQIKELKEQVAPLREQYGRARPVYERLIDYKDKQGGKPLSPKAERDLEKLRGVIHEIGEKETELNFELSVLESQAETSDTVKIIIQDTAYSGTELSFFDKVKTIDEPIRGGTFMLVKGEIKQVKTSAK